MRESDIVGLVVMVGFLGVLSIVTLAIIAGNVVNQLFAPFPSIGGPLGAAVALAVFVGVGLKILKILFK